MEDGKAAQAGNALYVGDTFCYADCDRVSQVLDMIVGEGRILAIGVHFEKIMDLSFASS